MDWAQVTLMTVVLVGPVLAVVFAVLEWWTWWRDERRGEHPPRRCGRPS